MPDIDPEWQPLPVMGTQSTGASNTAPVLVDEADAKALLQAAGIHCPRGVKVMASDDLGAAVLQLTPPLALKGLGHAHKSEAGLVKLGLSAEDVPIAAKAMRAANGFLVEEMAPPPCAELLVGLRRDPLYGIALTVGMGGVTAELLRDTQTLILPVSEGDIRDALDRLKMAPLLNGYRGSKAADCAAAASAIVAMAQLMNNDPTIEEIEINPLMLGTDGDGVIAADAVIWKKPSDK